MLLRCSREIRKGHIVSAADKIRRAGDGARNGRQQHLCKAGVAPRSRRNFGVDAAETPSASARGRLENGKA